jgi:hypothetical protein
MWEICLEGHILSTGGDALSECMDLKDMMAHSQNIMMCNFCNCTPEIESISGYTPTVKSLMTRGGWLSKWKNRQFI